MAAIDSSGDGCVDFGEFRAALQFVPLASLAQCAQKWAQVESLPDVGGVDLAPNTTPIPGLQVWQTVVAGGCGGVASRTLTAPLERAAPRRRARRTPF